MPAPTSNDTSTHDSRQPRTPVARDHLYARDVDRAGRSLSRASSSRRPNAPDRTVRTRGSDAVLSRTRARPVPAATLGGSSPAWVSAARGAGTVIARRGVAVASSGSDRTLVHGVVSVGSHGLGVFRGMTPQLARHLFSGSSTVAIGARSVTAAARSDSVTRAQQALLAAAPAGGQSRARRNARRAVERDIASAAERKAVREAVDAVVTRASLRSAG